MKRPYEAENVYEVEYKVFGKTTKKVLHLIHQYGRGKNVAWDFITLLFPEFQLQISTNILKDLITAYDATEDKSTFVYENPDSPIWVHELGLTGKRLLFIQHDKKFTGPGEIITRFTISDPDPMLKALARIYHENMED